jgi:hypothetical protein
MQSENVVNVENVKIENVKIEKIDKKKAKESAKDNEFVMPTKENYDILLSKNYTIKQLREIANHHKIKLKGISVKTDILARIYNYFKLYDSAFVIQKAWRQYLFRHYNRIKGPARFKRSLCVNDTDFFTMDDIKDIPYNQFFSFKDYDNTIYGFDIMSIYNLFDKSYDKITNPYNRNPFPRLVKKNMMKIIWLSKLFKDKIQLRMDVDNDTTNTNQSISILDVPLDINTHIASIVTNTNMNAPVMNAPVMTIEHRIMTLFHDMDLLGNYTHASWLLDLTQVQLVRFVLELNDIWSFRAGLSDQAKRNICPAYRDLFRMLYVIDMRIAPRTILRELALDIIEKLVRNGSNRDHKCLGTNYVLCALTMVSHQAAEALPWLYQSVV